MEYEFEILQNDEWQAGGTGVPGSRHRITVAWNELLGGNADENNLRNPLDIWEIPYILGISRGDGPRHSERKMKATTYTVNKAGLREIAEFLGENHKGAVKSGEGASYWTDSMLQAWAQEAEFQASEGNPAQIEICGAHSVSGTPMTFTVSDAGLDAQEIEIED